VGMNFLPQTGHVRVFKKLSFFGLFNGITPEILILNVF